MDNDLVLRPITGPGELDTLFRSLRLHHSSQSVDDLAADLAAGRRRPEWMWLALRGGRPLATAAWWTRAGHSVPLLLDHFEIDDAGPHPDRVDVGVKLLRAALARTVPPGHRPPDYSRFVPPDWRETAAGRQSVEDRMAALAQVGARPLVERLRLAWRSGSPPPGAPGGPLTFRPVRDPEELIHLMTLVLEGTLDAHSRADLVRLSAREVATEHYEDELARYPSPRSWWRVATRPDGEPVGFVLPARNEYRPIIAYLGVLPAHRGRGHVHALLAEGTRVLVDQGATEIHAATDVGNTPMARAFHRAGYTTIQRIVNLTWH